MLRGGHCRSSWGRGPALPERSDRPPLRAQKDTVVLPGVDGVFGIKANHVPLISQLKPGVVELVSGSESEKFFISGGFAFVHPNGVADICVLEAAPLDQFDSASVKASLAAASAQQGQGDEQDQAVARTAVELFSALDQALDSKA
jgi:F-type H+-transporting ATPase subunit delta